MRKVGLCALIVLVSFVPALCLKVPALKGRVNDYAGILEPEDERALDNYLASLESSTTAQLALLTIPSLEGDPLEDFSLRVADAWKLGRRDVDNGLLMVVAVEDRAIRIEVGYGLEGTLPDGKCGTIIRQVIVPQFRNGNYYEGISQAFEVMGQAIAGDPSQLKVLESHETKSGKSGIGSFFIGLIFLFIVLKIVSPCRKGRWYSSRPGGGWRTFGGGFGGFSGGRSSGSSGFGGGGFSGGGGSFGGGGASGRW